MSNLTEKYQPTDRRPIASRERAVWKRVAVFLADRHVSPNAISVAGMAAGAGAGCLLAATGFIHAGWFDRVLWLGAALGIQLRLLANMLDGMVALASKRASPLGELYNELPDRVSDVAILVGAGYAAGGLPALGYVSACIAVLTAYVRAVGKAAGASQLFVGPMAKPHRMFVLTMAALGTALTPAQWELRWGQLHLGWVSIALGIIVVGGLMTIFRRVALVVHHLERRL